MVQLVANQPHRSKLPQVVVENPLEPGRHRFSLVVVDEADNESAPFELTVTVVERTAPVPRPDRVLDTTTLRRPIPIDRVRLRRPS